MTAVGTSYDAAEDMITISDETLIEPGEEAVSSADGAIKSG